VNIPFLFISLVLACSARSHSPGLCNFRSLASHPVSAHKSCRGIIENMFYVNSPAFPGLTPPVLITGKAYTEFCTMVFRNIIYYLIKGKFISVGKGFLRNVPADPVIQNLSYISGKEKDILYLDPPSPSPSRRLQVL
jgi:hypothetical protein